MAIRNRTVEFMRFGDPSGVIRISDQYIRTIGSEPAQEVRFGIPQENFDRGMKALDYAAFRLANPEEVYVTAESFIKELIPHLTAFLGGNLPPADDGLLQIDLVTQAQELAQLPFEMLEELFENLVITRRVRQPWPVPAVMRAEKPKILFAWAGPGRRHGVPHEAHRELLNKIVNGGTDGEFVELPNANKASLQAALMTNSYTHLHLLAHGIPAPEPTPDFGKPVNLDEPLPAPISLALTGDDGDIERCTPKELAAMFDQMAYRPECATVATCHSAEIDPVRSGGTFAHAVHTAGVPVVVASQFALTKVGSDRLIMPFLANVIAGVDPRVALHECRRELRNHAATTYYDRIALTGYVQLDDGHEERLKNLRIKVQMRRLNNASYEAHARLDGLAGGSGRLTKALKPRHLEEIDRASAEFDKARRHLAQMEAKEELSHLQIAELRGLQASAFKRQAEAMWKLSQRVAVQDAPHWLAGSRELLTEARIAYRHAASVSRDHHWSWVQWLVLEAVQTGTLKLYLQDWYAAVAASEDAAELWREALDNEVPDAASSERAIYALGSLCELHVLAPLVGRIDVSDTQRTLDRFCTTASAHVGKFANRQPILNTIAQFRRYIRWWDVDKHWPLPKEIVTQASACYDTLRTQFKNY